MLIGIGAGNPDYITMQAINALKQWMSSLSPIRERKRRIYCVPEKTSVNAICRQNPTESSRFETQNETALPMRTIAVAAWHEQRGGSV